MRLALLLLFPISLFSLDYRPWYNRDLEIHPALTYGFETFSRVNHAGHSYHRSQDLHLAFFNLSSSYTPYGGEIEISCAKTPRHPFQFDATRASLRYQLSSDTSGDILSMTTGLVLSAVSRQALHDVGIFHQGDVEAEVHLAIGKEQSSGPFWVGRGYLVEAFGVASKGSPYLRSLLSYERNYCDLFAVSLFLDGLWGLGSQNLSCPFHGYAKVNYQALDAGLKLLINTCEWGFLEIQYEHRLHARNCPAGARTFFLSYTYPFGL